jgi:hypothetical protein
MAAPAQVGSGNGDRLIRERLILTQTGAGLQSSRQAPWADGENTLAIDDVCQYDADSRQ